VYLCSEEEHGSSDARPRGAGGGCGPSGQQWPRGGDDDEDEDGMQVRGWVCVRAGEGVCVRAGEGGCVRAGEGVCVHAGEGVCVQVKAWVCVRAGEGVGVRARR